MSSISPQSYSPHGANIAASTSCIETAMHAAALSSSPSTSTTTTTAHYNPPPPRQQHHHSQGLLSKLRKQAPRLFNKSKSARPSSGHSYLRQGKGGAPGIQSEPPSLTGYSIDQDQEMSPSTSPKTSRPESSSDFFQTASFNPTAAEVAARGASWQQVHGSPGCWCFGNESAQQATVQIKETSMLVLTEMEKASLREIALQILLKDRDMNTTMATYIERLGPNANNSNSQAAQDDQKKQSSKHGGGVSKFFSRLSHLRFSTGSYSSTNPPQRGAAQGGGLLRRSKANKSKMPPSSEERPTTAFSAHEQQGASVAPNLVFGTTLKRCLANEILAERKRLMRLERESRSGRLPLPSSRRLEPLSTSNQEDRLQIPTEKSGNSSNPQPLSKRQHLPLNRRSSVNGVGLNHSHHHTSRNEKAAAVIHAENDIVNDDADSGFQEDNEAPSVKATSFDTGRRFERCGESAGPMPLQVPQFVRKCVRHIETYGMDVEGIFRLGTSKKRIKSQIAEIQKSADFTFTEENSVHDTAALLKEYFRDLPEPLLTRSLYAAFVAIGSFEERARCQSLLRLLILLLPSVHRDTLYFLLVFLRSVASHAVGVAGGGNKMTSHNLATLFGPNILRMSGLSGGGEQAAKMPDAADLEAFSGVVLKNADQQQQQQQQGALYPGASLTMPRKSSQHFIVESQDRADERLAVIAVVQILIEDCEAVFQIPIELMDQMFAKMFQGDLSSMRHNSTVVKTRYQWMSPPLEAVERLLFKRAGCRLVRTATGTLVAESEAMARSNNNSNNNGCCCSRSDFQASQRHHTTSCCYNNNDSTLLSCASFSVQSSPTVASAPDKGNNRNGATNDEGATTRPTAEEYINASLHPAVTACVSRSEGDLTTGRRTFDMAVDDPRFFRLTGRPRPRRYGESYAAKIRINDELLQAASTWDELRTAIAHNSTSPSHTYSNTMPRITVTVAPSSAPDTPIPSQARA